MHHEAHDEDDDGTEESNTTRRWLIRVLVGLGIGVPITIEGVTFLGLIRSRLLGGDDGDGGDGGGGEDTPSGTPTRTRTPVPTFPPEGVGVGDELLPATPQVDRVREAVVVPADGARTFSLTVAIENTGEERYELTLGQVTTEDGRQIPGDSPASGQIDPGETGVVEGTWELPQDATPASIQVVAVTFPEGETVVEDVPLAPVPVEEDGG